MKIFNAVKLLFSDRQLFLKKLHNNFLVFITLFKKRYQFLKSNNGVKIKLDLSLDKNIKWMLYGRYEEPTVKIIKKYLKSGDTFIDIGANIGYMSYIGADLIGGGGGGNTCI